MSNLLIQYLFRYSLILRAVLNYLDQRPLLDNCMSCVYALWVSPARTYLCTKFYIPLEVLFLRPLFYNMYHISTMPNYIDFTIQLLPHHYFIVSRNKNQSKHPSKCILMNIFTLELLSHKWMRPLLFMLVIMVKDYPQHEFGIKWGL